MKYIIDEEEFKLKTAEYLDSNYQTDQLSEILFKDKQPVEEIIVHGCQGDTKTNEAKLYISKNDYMKDLNFRKLYIQKAGE